VTLLRRPAATGRSATSGSATSLRPSPNSAGSQPSPSGAAARDATATVGAAAADPTGGPSARRQVYRHFGVTFSSPVRLALPEAAGPPTVDVHGPEPVETAGGLVWSDTTDERLSVHADAERIVLSWPSVRVAVSPREVRCSGEVDEWAAAILGAGWATLLALHGTETLHGGAVTSDRGSLLLLGPSGAGKSTLLWRLVHDGGHHLVADDMVPVDIDDLRPRSGSGIVRLRTDAAGYLGVPGPVDAAGKVRVRHAVAEDPAPVRTVVVLDARAAGLTEVTGARAMEALFMNLYSPITFSAEQRLRRFELAATLASAARVLLAPERTLTPGDLRDV
jgi:hypothetical protein